MNAMPLLKVTTILIAGLVSACGGGNKGSNKIESKLPIIDKFQSSPSSSNTNREFIFNWDIIVENNDSLVCELDADGDNTPEYTINDCSSDSTQLHVYANAGNYIAKLTVKGNHGSVEQSTLVTVTNTGPKFDEALSIASSTSAAGDLVLFTWAVSDSDNDALSCSLDVDNNNSPDYIIQDCATVTSQQHIYTLAGNYTAILMADDGQHAAIEQSVVTTITTIEPKITPPSIENFSVTSTQGNTGEEIVFSWTVNHADSELIFCTIDINGDNITDYMISDCGNTSSQSHTYATAGNYTAVLKVSDGTNATVQQTAPVTITTPNTTPSINDFSVTSTPKNTGNTIDLHWLVSDDDGDSLTCYLDIDSDNITDYTINDCTNTTHQMHHYLTAGEYRITLRIEDGKGAMVKKNLSVTVTNTAPSIDSFNTNETPYYTNAPTAITWKVSDIDNDTLTCKLHINLDDTDDYTIEDCSHKNSLEHRFKTEGMYTVQLSVSDGIDYIVQKTQIITVLPPLLATVSVNSFSTVTDNRLIYSITIGNQSRVAVKDVKVLLPVPGELSFNYTTDTEPDASGCGNINCDPGEEAVWLLNTLAAGESRSITLNAALNTALIDNTMIMTSFTISGADINETTQTKTIEVSERPKADLVLSASSSSIIAGETVKITVDLGNTGASLLSHGKLHTQLPAGVTINTISHDGIDAGSGEVTWDIADLSEGTTLQREITVTADSNLLAAKILQFTAKVILSDGLVIDNVAEYTVSILPTVLPINVDINTSTDSVVAGERLLYTLIVNNTGKQPINAVTALMRMPAEISFSATTDAAPDAEGCGNINCDPREEALWVIGTLAAGETRSITINALVNKGLSDGNLLVMPVRVIAEGIQDTIELQNVIRVQNVSLMELSLGATKDPVKAGETFKYIIDVGNVSQFPLNNAELHIYLPEGLTVTTISHDGVNLNAREILWGINNLDLGASLYREITVSANSILTAGEILRAMVQLHQEGELSLNQSASLAVSIANNASLVSATVETTPDAAAPGGYLAYKISVMNDSAIPVNNVNVVFRVPDELRFVYNTDANPDATGCVNILCDPREEAVFKLGTIGAGATKIVTINAAVPANIAIGRLITAPIRITATELKNTVNLQHTTAVQK